MEFIWQYFTININYSNKDLHALPDLSKYIYVEELDCSQNKLSYINVHHLPPNLKKLNISSNHFIEFPNLAQTKLTHIYCNYNKIEEIRPHLFPETLEVLSCNENEITLLEMSNTLRYLSCYKNHISQLVIFPSLINICCSNNTINNISDKALFFIKNSKMKTIETGSASRICSNP